MTDTLKNKLKTLPAEPGVYFHRDANRKIIYIGKAAVLKNRVMSYFQNTKNRDPKTTILVGEIFDTDWVTVGSEVEALFLESEMIKRYRPKYNVDLKDDKNFLYVKISAEEFPVVTYVRRPMDDKAHYYGPFTSTDALRRAMKYLRKIFPYVTHETWPNRACLQVHLGLCPGPEEGLITAVEYRKNIRRLELYLKGEQTKLMADLERAMTKAAAKNRFEEAAHLRDQLRDLRAFGKQMIFGDTELFDLTRDQALMGLAERLKLAGAPRRIECYDISHLGGVDNVASMVVFSDGVPNRDEYRRFSMRRGGNNDVAHMAEVMERRFSAKNLEAWPKPDLIIVDGGKGQLGASLHVLDRLGINIPAIGLAKRQDEIVRRNPRSARIASSEAPVASQGSTSTSPSASSPHPRTASPSEGFVSDGNHAAQPAGGAQGSGDAGDGDPGPHAAPASTAGVAKAAGPVEPTAPANESGHWDDEAWITQNLDWETILLPAGSHVLHLLQRVRDEAHRFAVTYQSILRGKRQTRSLLDDVPGVGPATRKKLIRQFGSVRGVKAASQDELTTAIGPALASVLREHLGRTTEPAEALEAAE